MGRIESLWSSLLTFLRRDIRSFWRGPIPKLLTVNLSMAEPVWPEPLASELDVKKLERIEFRRSVLDWRDWFCVHIGAVANESFSQFANHVEDEVSRVGIFRTIFTKPAGEILQPPFNAIFRAELINAVKEADRRLAQLLLKWPATDWPHFSVAEQYFDDRLACIAELGFKANNQEEILERVKEMIFEDEGLVETYRGQVINIAGKLIRTSEAEMTT